MQFLTRRPIRFIGLVAVLAATGVGGRAFAQILSGDVAGDAFGAAVTYAGDLNGDGYADFAVGVPFNDERASNAGLVHVYLGRDTMYPDQPDLVLRGVQGGDEFGYAVAGAGDLNNDGYDDLLVGAPGSDRAGIDAGRVFLFLGGAEPNAVSDEDWDGTLSGGRFGAALAGGFDFNGDDRDDFAVGAPAHNGSGLRAGEVTLFLSVPSGLPEATFHIAGDQPNWGLGQALDRAGDVDGDGFDDVIAGAPQAFDQNPGLAVIWFGQESTLTQPSRIELTGEVGTDRFGWDVSFAGDMNGDNRSDVLVGAPDHGLGNGAVYLFHGGSSMNSAHDWKVTGSTGGDELGTAVDGGFDMDGDGDPDVAAGAPGADDLGSGSGRVQIYLGGTPFNTGVDRSVTPVSPAPSFEASDAFGSTVRFVGSTNGDEFSELVAGAPTGNNTGGTVTGYVDFITHPGSFTPVRVVAFSASRVSGSIRLNWRLAEGGELAGTYLDRDSGNGFVRVHERLLDPWVTTFVDAQAPFGDLAYRLQGRLRDGGTRELATTRIAIDGALVVAVAANPFHDRLRLSVTQTGGPLTVEVFDTRGRSVAVLTRGAVRSGVVSLEWGGVDQTGRRAAPGMYFVRATAGAEIETMRVIRMP